MTLIPKCAFSGVPRAEGHKKEAPLEEGLLVLLRGGDTADSGSSLFAVAGNVLGQDAAGRSNGERLRSRSRIGR